MYVLLLPIKEKYHLNLSVSILINLTVDPPSVLSLAEMQSWWLKG